MGETAASNDGQPGRRSREAPPPVSVTRLAAIVAERLTERSEIR